MQTQLSQPTPPQQADDRHRHGWTNRLVHDKRSLILIVALVAVAGLSSVAILPRMEDPVLIKRAALIVTRLPGADASRVEALVTEKLEDRLREIEEIKEMRSQSRSGVSSISIELLDQVAESEIVWAKIRSKIEDSLPELPAQASRPEFDDLEVRAYARILSVVWDLETPVDYAVLRRSAKRLQDALQGMSGTESVDRFGDPGEEILVQVDPQRAAAMNLSAAEIAAQLKRFDAKDAAGQMRGAGLDLSLEVGNQFDDLSDVGRADVRAADGRFVRLDQIADISLATPQPMPRLGWHRERPAISLGVLIRPETRIDLWSLAADRVVDDFRGELPAGISICRVMDQSGYVSARLESLLANLAMGGVAVCAVILCLMGWRSAIVVASALPLTMLTVLFGMHLLKIPVHQMSVTGLIIALGLLIDNAIVVADEIQVEMLHGLSPGDAVAKTVRKLAIPLLGSTLTTALAFAPIVLMPGPAGEFVGSIAVSVIMAIFASLFYSLTVIAAFAALFIRVHDRDRKPRGWVGFLQNGVSPSWVIGGYRHVLRWLISHPRAAIAAAMVLPLAGFGVAPMLAEQFFPPADRDQFHIEVELATGGSIADTQRVAKLVDEVLADEAIQQIDWYFGESAPTFYYNVLANRKGTPNFGQAIIRVSDGVSVNEMIRRLQVALDAKVPEARVLVRQLEQGPPFNAPVEVRIFGPDLLKLRELGEQVRAVLASGPDVTHTMSLLSETLPKVRLQVDSQSASLAGLSPTQIADQVQASFDGELAGAVIQETEELPVRVRVEDRSRTAMSGVRSLELSATAEGAARMLPLRAVADWSLEPETGVIVRLDRRRMDEVSAFLTAGTLPATALADFRKRFEASGFELPHGYELAYGGEASKRDDAVGNLMASVGLLMVMMVATLVLSFGSFRLAAIIGLVGLLSIGLGLGSLWIFGFPFGFMAIIGTMGLIGIAINDSIVVLATLQEEHGRTPVGVESIVQTVVNCSRHVIATTLTTVAGFLPLIWSGGGFWPPLAIAIAGGVIGATLLALVFVPSAYRLVYCVSCCDASEAKAGLGAVGSGEDAAIEFAGAH
ncbi:Cobalt-zinc-cadmium resistance protein CzcA [Rosistilla carotiformis]|uniref:Cobalt-zinc-cadmium resistance protein CzcA n=1 Tax=Rosistilla carotiformis TaxID=2528017 RepID=A0A518JXW5_9BACT|nr:efflux RND transporter permease subunit [Rosistilla carotiformis]QDV70375.1 Cobalt-zinc-cadmium resistance protein CzcA [Rosistilla carotiformis]